MSGYNLIAAERQRQVLQEGWTFDHDDEHDDGELIRAAACYLDTARMREVQALHVHAISHPGWPWAQAFWKPSDDPIRNLVKAGALIAAEIDRLQRAADRNPTKGRSGDPLTTEGDEAPGALADTGNQQQPDDGLDGRMGHDHAGASGEEQPTRTEGGASVRPDLDSLELTLEQVADLLGCTWEFVSLFIHRGELASVVREVHAWDDLFVVSHRTLVTLGALHDFIERQW